MHKIIKSAPTVEATPDYSAGDLLGGKLAFPDAFGSKRSGALKSVTFSDKADLGVGVDLVLFDANPSNTTFTENSALTIHDADLFKVIGVVHIVAGDYVSFGDNNTATKHTMDLPIQLNGTDDLYACMVAQGTMNFASTSDIQIVLGLDVDE